MAVVTRKEERVPESLEPELEGYDWSDFENVIGIDGAGPEAALRAAEERIHQEGWDQKPKLCIISGNEAMAALEEISLSEDVTDDFVTGFPAFVTAFAAVMWETRRDPEFPGLIGAIQNEILGPSFYGILVTYEGWTVRPPDAAKDPEKWVEFAKAVRSGNLRDHPDRVEIRNTVMMSAGKKAYGILRYRDGEIVYAEEQSIDNPMFLENPITRAMVFFLGLLIGLMIHKGLVNEQILKEWEKEFKFKRKGEG